MHYIVHNNRHCALQERAMQTEKLLETNTQFQKHVLNTVLDFRQTCEQYGINLRAAKSGVCFCPFHYNKNTPSAKVYEDSLYCFSENRSFKVSSLFEYELVQDTLQNAFNNIWCLLGSDARDELINSFKLNENNSTQWMIRKELTPLYDYRRGVIDYRTYCDRLLNCMSEIARS